MQAQMSQVRTDFKENIVMQFAEARKMVKPCSFIGFQESNTALQNAKKLLRTKTK